MRTIAAGVFKAKCLAIMDEVNGTHEPVIVTKNGKPVIQVIAVLEDSMKDPIFGFFKDRLKIVGDIESPVPAGEWKMLRD